MRTTEAATLRLVLVASSLVLVGLSVYLIREGHLRWAISPLIVGVAAMILSVARQSLSLYGRAALDVIGDDEQPDHSAPLSTEPRQPTDGVRRWGIFSVTESGVAAVCLIISALLLWVSLRQFGASDAESRSLAWFAYGVSMVALLAALPAIDGRWMACWRRLTGSDGVHIRIDALWPWLVLAGVLVLAAGIRLYNLDQLPAGLWFDEADNLIQAREIARNPGNMKVYVPSTNLPSMYLMPVAMVVKLAGVAITTGRLVSVAFSLAGIVAVFLLVRLILGPWQGVAAAFLVAVMRWDINWSRIGMHGITAPLFAALTAYLTLRALRSDRVSDYGLAGVSLGLSMWLYTSLRMFPLVVGFMLLHHLVFRRPALKGYLGRIGVCVLTSLAVAAPVLQFAIDEPGVFFARTDDTSVFKLVPRDQIADRITDSLAQHAMMFHQQGDPNPRHNLPGLPMLDHLTGVLMLLGMGLALWRWKDAALIILPIWVFFMILPGVLTVPWEAPQSLRAISVIPAVAAMGALVLGIVWKTGHRAPSRWVRLGTAPFVLAILATIGYMNVGTYFGAQAEDPEVFAAFSTDETLMARHMTEQQRRGYSLWVSRQFLFGLTSTLLANHPRFEIIRAPETIPLDSTAVWRGAAIYLEPRESGFYHTLKAYYPGARFTEVRAPGGGDPLYYSAVISAEQLAARQGWQAEYTTGDGSELGPGHTTSNSVWRSDRGPDQFPYDLHWHGSLHVVHPGDYVLKLDGDVDASLELNGRIVLNQETPQVRLTPAIGLHDLSVRARVREGDRSIRVLWQPPGGELAEIPFANLYNGTVRPIGLTGRFFSGTVEKQAPDAAHITPSTDNFYYTPVLEEPYLAVWDGTLKIETPGVYRFYAEGAGTVELAINGDLVAVHPPTNGLGSTAEIGLQAGEARVQITYQSPSPPSRFKVWWAPMGKSMEPIPQEQLTPAIQRRFRLLE